MIAGNIRKSQIVAILGWWWEDPQPANFDLRPDDAGVSFCFDSQLLK
jgi:hypothetical protein